MTIIYEDIITRRERNFRLDIESNSLNLFHGFNEFCNLRVHCTLCNSPFHTKGFLDALMYLLKINIQVLIFIYFYSTSW